IVERAYFLPEKDERTDYFILLEHRHRQDSAIAAELGGRHRQGIALKVRLLDRDVCGLRHAAGHYRADKGNMRTGPHWTALHEFGKRLRRVVDGAESQSIALCQHQDAELGLAYACC